MARIKRINHATYLAFRKRYYKSSLCKEQRLGQAFLNEFFPKVTDPDTFYETAPYCAEGKIIDKYVDMDAS